MARLPLHNDAHEARLHRDTSAPSGGEALAGLRRLHPLRDWLLTTFTLDRWLVASVAAIAIVAAGVVSTSFLGGEQREGVVLPPLRDPQDMTLVQVEPPSEPAAASIVVEPQERPAPTAAPAAANRADCEAIRGTAYLSDVERFWFVASCVEHEPVFVSSAGAGAGEVEVSEAVAVAEPEAPAVVEPEPAAPVAVVLPSPAPTPAYSGDDAAYVVFGWLVYQGYVPVDGSCRGSGSGNDWVVTCLVESTGDCATPGCVTLVKACLIPEPRTAWFC